MLDAGDVYAAVPRKEKESSDKKTCMCTSGSVNASYQPKIPAADSQEADLQLRLDFDSASHSERVPQLGEGELHAGEGGGSPDSSRQQRGGGATTSKQSTCGLWLGKIFQL